MFTISCPPDKGDTGGFRKRAYLPYNHHLVAKARENRRNPTLPEKKMWYKVLTGKRLLSHKFLRQKPIDRYIVDFYCSELLLVIEVDGDSHALQANYDRARTERLGRYGIQVIRYTNDDVMNRIEYVNEDLERAVGEREGFMVRMSGNPLCPPCQGDPDCLSPS